MKKDNKQKIQINGELLWYDDQELKASRDFMDRKQKEYWEYHFSGQRTIDMFGVEGAKRILEEQDKRDEEWKNINGQS